MVREREQIVEQLLRRLGRGRSRARLVAVLRLFAGFLVLASSAMVVLILLEQLTPFQTDDAWRWLVPVLVIMLAVALPVTLSRTPDIHQLARAADIRFGLQERISTAVEVAASEREVHSDVRRRLLEDASRHAQFVEPTALVPIRVPKLTWLALALFTLAGGTQWFLETADAGPSSQPLTSAIQPEERENIIRDLERAAELVGTEAERNRDPYLDALSQALGDLARRAEAGLLNDQALQRETADLADHVRRAYGEELGSRRHEEPGELANQQEASEAGATADEGTEQTGGPLTGEPGGALTGDFEGLLADLEAVEARHQEDEAGNQLTRVDYAEFGPYVDAATIEYLRELEERRRAAERTGQPAGVAQEADDRPGDAAGEGTPPLVDGEGGEVELRELLSEEVVLPEIQSGEGTTVQTEMAPQADLTDVAEVAPETNAWETGRESELRRTSLSPVHRAVVSRYFASDPVDESVQLTSPGDGDAKD